MASYFRGGFESSRLLSYVFLPRCGGWARLSPESMARAKTSEPSRVRSKTATVEELTRGVGNLQEFLAKVEDLGREGFPYLDAARARTELQFRECIRRTFGEKSPEFQEHRHHRLLMDTPEGTQQSIALIKTLIATLERKKRELRGEPPPQQIPPAPPVSPPSAPVRPQMTVVPASISTVQMTLTQTGTISPSPVTMTTNLGVAQVAAVPNPSPVSLHKPEPLSPSTSVPERSSILPAPVAMAMSQTHFPAQPVVPVAPEPKLPPPQLGLAPAPIVPSPPSALPVSPAPVHRPEAMIPSMAVPEPLPVSPAPVVMVMPHPPSSLEQVVSVGPEPPPSRAGQTAQADGSVVGRSAQSPQSELEPSVHQHPIASPQPTMQEAPAVLQSPKQAPVVPTSVFSPLEPGGQLAQAASDPVALVKVVCGRFHAVVRQLRLRGEHRATLQVEDEVDAQDLLHALLRVQFNDIDTDEWTPSYSSGALRMTLLLDESRLAVIVKKTRPGLTAKDLTDQLRVDAARYRFHGRCTTLLCFMYDPDGRIGNPQGFETSLASVNDSFTVDVLVAPK
jgi:REase_DpnII-MboI